MDAIPMTVADLLVKYIEPIFKALWRIVVHALIGIKKLVFPVKDLRTGIKQSRMRYYLVQFSYRNGQKPISYQEVDSNGQVKRYVDRQGKRFIAEEIHEYSVIADGQFQLPEWQKIDWKDIFNGNTNSGCWAITER
jgi:hypothetical protein